MLVKSCLASPTMNSYSLQLGLVVYAEYRISFLEKDVSNICVKLLLYSVQFTLSFTEYFQNFHRQQYGEKLQSIFKKCVFVFMDIRKFYSESLKSLRKKINRKTVFLYTQRY
jgi:hypothetical protein